MKLGYTCSVANSCWWDNSRIYSIPIPVLQAVRWKSVQLLQNDNLEQDTSGKSRPRKRQRSVPLGKSNLSNGSAGNGSASLVTAAVEAPSGGLDSAPACDSPDTDPAAAANLKFLVRNKRSDHSRQVALLHRKLAVSCLAQLFYYWRKDYWRILKSEGEGLGFYFSCQEFYRFQMTLQCWFMHRQGSSQGECLLPHGIAHWLQGAERIFICSALIQTLLNPLFSHTPSSLLIGSLSTKAKAMHVALIRHAHNLLDSESICKKAREGQLTHWRFLHLQESSADTRPALEFSGICRTNTQWTPLEGSLFAALGVHLEGFLTVMLVRTFQPSFATQLFFQVRLSC